MGFSRLPKRSLATKKRLSSTWITVGCLVTLLVTIVTDFELQRISNGDLFLFQMPWEQGPSEIETEDAVQSVTENRIATRVALIVTGLTVIATGGSIPSCFASGAGLSHVTLSLFALAVAADLASTIWFFHSLGVEFEFHPAIRLFGYAYGRSVGPIAGKLIQAIGVIYVAVLLKERGRFLVYFVSAAYLGAAAFNIWNTI